MHFAEGGLLLVKRWRPALAEEEENVELKKKVTTVRLGKLPLFH